MFRDLLTPRDRCRNLYSKYNASSSTIRAPIRVHSYECLLASYVRKNPERSVDDDDDDDDNDDDDDDEDDEDDEDGEYDDDAASHRGGVQFARMCACVCFRDRTPRPQRVALSSPFAIIIFKSDRFAIVVHQSRTDLSLIHISAVTPPNPNTQHVSGTCRSCQGK